MTMQMTTIAAYTYAAMAMLTYAFLTVTSGYTLRRRARQAAVSLVWPIYWPVFQGMEKTIRMLIKLTVSIAFIALLPLLVPAALVAMIFIALGDAGYAPRWLAED